MSAPDKSFDGDGEEQRFWHERDPCVIMMSLEVYSETDRRRLLYCAAPEGRHYQLELSRNLSPGQTHRKYAVHTHTYAQEVCAHSRGYTHAGVCFCAQTHHFPHRQASITLQMQVYLASDTGRVLLLLNLTNSSISKRTPLWTSGSY